MLCHGGGAARSARASERELCPSNEARDPPLGKLGKPHSYVRLYNANVVLSECTHCTVCYRIVAY